MADSNYVFNFDFRELIEAHKKSGADITMMYRRQEIPKAFLKPNSNYNELYYTLDTDGDKVKKIYINAKDSGKVDLHEYIYNGKRKNAPSC